MPPSVPKHLVLIICVITTVACASAADEPPTQKTKKKPFVKITISKETTYLDGPLTDDGCVDYLTALNDRFSKGVTVDNNAAVLIWRALGPGSDELDEAIRDEFFKKLGIGPLPAKGDYFVPLFKIAEREAAAKGAPPADAQVVAQELNDQMNQAMKQLWSKDDYPGLVKWIEANEKPLALITEGTRRARYYSPMLTLDDSEMLIMVRLPTCAPVRDLARLLSTRAMHRLDQADYDGAWQDLLTCHRLARHVGHGPTIIEGLVAIAVDGIASQGDVALAKHAHLMSGHLLKMRGDLEKLPPHRKMAEYLDSGERFFFLDSVMHLARNGEKAIRAITGDDGPTVLTKLMSNALIDWNEPLKIGNQWYDKMAEASRKPTYGEFLEASNVLEEQMQESAEKAADIKSLAVSVLLSGSPRKAIGRQIGAVLCSLILPAVSAVREAEVRSEVTFDLTRLAFALAAYDNDHGKFPESLDKLSPNYIPTVPKDSYIAGPLKYETADDGYLLYSVGRNLRDDGGKGHLTDSQEGDDLAIRVTSKR